MKGRLSSIDKERLNYINYLMDDLYNDMSDLYESLVDREMEETKTALSNMILKLRDLQEMSFIGRIREGTAVLTQEETRASLV
jgi:hypothetical protein